MIKLRSINKYNSSNYTLTISLIIILLFLIVASIFLGKTNLLMLILSEKSNDFRELIRIIILEIRLPRTLLALVAGFSFGICGAAMQGLFRNPLADPKFKLYL